MRRAAPTITRTKPEVAEKPAFASEQEEDEYRRRYREAMDGLTIEEVAEEARRDFEAGRGEEWP